MRINRMMPMGAITVLNQTSPSVRAWVIGSISPRSPPTVPFQAAATPFHAPCTDASSLSLGKIVPHDTMNAQPTRNRLLSTNMLSRL